MSFTLCLVVITMLTLWLTSDFWLWKKSIFSLLLAGGEVLPVSRRAANEDVENVNFAPRRIEVRAAQLCTTQHQNTSI